MDERFLKSLAAASIFAVRVMQGRLLARPRKTALALVLATPILFAGLFPFPARAADGCLVLLCLAAPSWNNIAQCVDPVRSALNDLAHGRPFPSCDMSGSGNGAANHPSNAPSYCPPQYTTANDLESSTTYECAYAGAIEVDVNGVPWTRTWWSTSGASVTEYTAAARAQLGTWDPRFDDDYAAWLQTQAPSPSPSPVN